MATPKNGKLKFTDMEKLVVYDGVNKHAESKPVSIFMTRTPLNLCIGLVIFYDWVSVAAVAIGGLGRGGVNAVHRC